VIGQEKQEAENSHKITN